MSRIYSATFSEIAVTAQQDLFQLEANTVSIILHAAYISQTSLVADAADAAVSILIRRFTDAVTNDVAEVKLDPADANALADVAINETSELVTGTEIIHAEGWHMRNTFIYLPLPEHRPVIKIGDGVAINLNTTDTVTMSGTIYWEEVGN